MGCTGSIVNIGHRPQKPALLLATRSGWSSDLVADDFLRLVKLQDSEPQRTVWFLNVLSSFMHHHVFRPRIVSTWYSFSSQIVGFLAIGFSINELHSIFLSPLKLFESCFQT